MGGVKETAFSMSSCSLVGRRWRVAGSEEEEEEEEEGKRGSTLL